MTETIFDLIDAVDEDSCWLYQGPTFPSGHGKWKKGKSFEYAHVFVWLEFGLRIPEGQHLASNGICDNPLCCNPKHWKLITPFVNPIPVSGKVATPIVPLRKDTNPTLPKLSAAPAASSMVYDRRRVRPEQQAYILSSPFTIDELAKQMKISRGIIWDIRHEQAVKDGTAAPHVPVPRRVRGLSNDTVVDIRNSKERMDELSERLGVSKSTIGRIRAGMIYTDVR